MLVFRHLLIGYQHINILVIQKQTTTTTLIWLRKKFIMQEYRHVSRDSKLYCQSRKQKLANWF